MEQRGLPHAPVALSLVAALLVVPAAATAASVSDPGSEALPGDAPAAEDPVDEPFQEDTSGWIQPGDRVSAAGSSSGFCTLNFAVTDGDTYYVGTAGHCFDTGTDVEVGSTTIGTVVASEHGGVGSFDWAFIEIEDEHAEDVNPTVRRWSGPVKAPASLAGDVARTVQPHPGDPLLYYGQGGHGGRAGVTALWAGSTFHFVGDIAVGDSGGPILNSKGQAVGIITAITPSFNVATNFQSALDSFEAQLGEDLSLVPGEPFLVDDACPGCPSTAPADATLDPAEATPLPAAPQP